MLPAARAARLALSVEAGMLSEMGDIALKINGLSIFPLILDPWGCADAGVQRSTEAAAMSTVARNG